MGTTKPRPAGKNLIAQVQALPDKTFIIDNGAYTMKAGYAPDTAAPNVDDEENALSACATIPNAISKTRGNRTYVGAQIGANVTDWNEMSFRRPVEKGYIVNWEAQKEIWECSFFDEKTVRSKELRIAEPEDVTLIFTEAPNALPALQKNTDEIIMEEWGFGGYLRCAGPSLNAWNEVQTLFEDPIPEQPPSAVSPTECILVVDSGYSHTIATPVYKGQPIQRAIRRLDLGGKHLTNYLKELVSMRQYNMVDETYIMNQVKESVCFVSNDFGGDLERTWKGNRKRGHPSTEESVVVDYVLPDPNGGKSGFMRPHDPLLGTKKRKAVFAGAGTDQISEDVLVLGNERFTVPEILFTPGDVGMKTAGIPDLILQSLSVLPPGLHPAFLANVMVVGGNSLLDGFMERLQTELRQVASAECVVRVRRPSDPIRSSWLGASRLATNKEELRKVAITRQDYQEYGSTWSVRKFSGGL
ncbi:actin family [Aspergillus karnatakaensis]|uniref:actin family protein n=1 Tax=Aspergillus karnatakaensis TaxID=1810916 RepID=UPI003CCDF6E3